MNDCTTMIVEIEAGVINLADQMFSNRLFETMAARWLKTHDGMTMTWEFVAGRATPRPLDEGARQLAAHARSHERTMLTVACLMDAAEAFGFAVWCWREGGREFVRIEPRPRYAMAA